MTIEHINAYGKETTCSLNVSENSASVVLSSDKDIVLSDSKYVLFPGFADVHVHLREPGFSYKETVYTGTMAAAHGGYTAVCCMPNLRPVPDNSSTLCLLEDIIQRDACVRVYPYGAVTEGENGCRLSDFTALANRVIAFSDDGRGIQDETIMRQAMLAAKSVGKIIAAHCEDNSLLNGGCIHDGEYAHIHGYPGISSESEWRQIERDIRLAEETGCAYHVCHISCKESVALIRKAKSRGVDITCETAPHYLMLDDSMLKDLGCYKMNPPLRSRMDREALIEGIIDGTIDMIATDHAPHSAAEKSNGLAGSLNGIVGLETSFSVLYTGLVLKKIISLDRLINLLAITPRKRFGIPFYEDDFTLFDITSKRIIDPEKFKSKGRSTPFESMEVYGKCLMTAVGGKPIWNILTEN